MTTCIKHYVEDFKMLDIAKACERIGKGQTKQGTSHPKYLKYKGKTAKQLVYEWTETADIACAKGSIKHNYLEEGIKVATGFITSDKKYTGNRTYTIQDIVGNHDFGRIDISYFGLSGIRDKYPIIYNTILSLHEQGYSFYAEIAVFDINRLISGLIDLLAINHNNKTFVILDWKTNRNPITFTPGYFEKDEKGRITDTFIEKFSTFAPPIDNVPDSVGHKYSMQVSGYASLVELFGFTYRGNIICHIGLSDVNDDDSPEVVKLILAQDLRREANIMFNDFSSNLKRNQQSKMFI
jgi:hypothetical protein